MLMTRGVDINIAYMNDLGIPGYAGVITATDETIAERGDVLIRWLRAEIKGWQWHLENPEEMAELMVSTYGQRGLDLEAQTVESRSWPISCPSETPRRTAFCGWSRRCSSRASTSRSLRAASRRRGHGRRCRHAGADRRGARRCLTVMTVLSGTHPCPRLAGHWQAAPGRLSAIGGASPRMARPVQPATGSSFRRCPTPMTTGAACAPSPSARATTRWRSGSPRLGLEPATDPYLRAAVAFARMAEGGVATLNHCHNTADPTAWWRRPRPSPAPPATSGVRVAFAVPISGRNPLTYGDPGPLLERLPPAQAAALRNRPRAALRPAEQFAMVEEVSAFEHDCFTVQYGPVGPQWVDDAILAKIAEASAQTGAACICTSSRPPIRRNGPRPPIRAACYPSRRHRPSVRAPDGGPWRPSRRCRLRAAGGAGRACVGQHLVQPEPSVGTCRQSRGSCATGCVSALASTGWPSTMTRTRCANCAWPGGWREAGGPRMC
jgi:hypothetical protein